jgi:hypothetical protein
MRRVGRVVRRGDLFGVVIGYKPQWNAVRIEWSDGRLEWLEVAEVDWLDGS